MPRDATLCIRLSARERRRVQAGARAAAMYESEFARALILDGCSVGRRRTCERCRVAPDLALGVRVSEHEHSRIRLGAMAAGTGVTTFVREASLEAARIALEAKEDRERPARAGGE